MGKPTRYDLSSVLLGDELGQIKLIQLDPRYDMDESKALARGRPVSTSPDYWSCFTGDMGDLGNQTAATRSSTATRQRSSQLKNRIVRIYDRCLQREPAASRAITNIRPIEGIHESNMDTTDRANHLFLITNKVGQLFVCDTNSIRNRLRYCTKVDVDLQELETVEMGEDEAAPVHEAPILSPIYYNMNNKVPVCGGQPINQTNVLVVYMNGDIQHINIPQDTLQSSLKIKRKAIRTLGLGYNSDAQAVHWRIDGSTGICYFDTEASSAHLNEHDPLTDIVLSSPTHRISKKRLDHSQQKQYNQSPCIKSRKYNEQGLLVPTHVINMITSRADQEKGKSRNCKWSSITSLNLIYRKLALYDLIGSGDFGKCQKKKPGHEVTNFKLNDNRLAVGGRRYTLRVYDVQTQKAIYNCRTGHDGNPLVCPSKGEPCMVGDVDWLGGNKTTKRTPNMLAVCSGVDSIVNVYDLRSYKPVFHIDLTQETESRWQPYENHPRGCMFTRICASGAPYSTAVPSQQLALGSTNGQVHIIDLRFAAKSFRPMGKLSGFCGGSVREIRFVSESFDTSKMISCATDRFVRIHKIHTSFTSVVSQKLATEVFLGTRPTCIQPVCDEVTQNYLANVGSSDSDLSRSDSDSWSML